MRLGRSVYAHEHERRLKRDARKGVYGEPVRLVIDQGAYDGHSAGKCPVYSTHPRLQVLQTLGRGHVISTR